MGIGAYQVREFIQGMGGKLSVNSELNVGTTVCITLPINKSAVSDVSTRRMIKEENIDRIASNTGSASSNSSNSSGKG